MATQPPITISQATFITALRNITDVIQQYSIVREQEITKRLEIQQQRDIAISKIQAEKEIILTYLQQTFQERREVLHELFQTLDEAVKRGNIEIVDKSLSGIMTTIQSSPFKDFADFKRKLQEHETIEL
jgi:hypothetical protein